MGKTSIQWATRTWNPVRGCSRVSRGCERCYAERMSARELPGLNSPTTGEPFAIMKNGRPHWTGHVELVEHMLDLPTKWRKPQVIFVNSMSDLFHEKLPFEDIDRVRWSMCQAPHHSYIVLTKRASRMRQYFEQLLDATSSSGVLFSSVVPTHLTLGVSAENKPTADERIPDLLATPAVRRIVSYEPALEWVDFGRAYDRRGRGLDQIIMGGESGPNARPFDVAWARKTRDQCKRAGVPFFLKQIGSNVIDRNDVGFEGDTPRSWPMDTRHEEIGNGYQGEYVRIRLKDRKGGEMAEWPEDLRVRES